MTEVLRCVACTAVAFPDERFCGTCGAPLDQAAADTVRPDAGKARTRVSVTIASPTVPCTQCGTDLLADETFCPGCGGRRAGSSASVTNRVRLAREELLEKLRAATAGEYEVIRELGRGGMAVVFLANDLRLPRKVAIKVMSPELRLSEEAVERFANEARTMASLKHENIVAIYTVRETPLHYFVMPFIEGRSLEEIHKKTSQLPIAVAQAILFQVASALAYGHRRPKPVIHRDVKPANIMISETGQAIVTDFGIAKEIVDAPGLKSTRSPIGTFEYMSPEQIRMAGVSGASDQYSLGVVAYELIAGRLPFEGTQGELMDAHRYHEPPPLEHHRPDCPPDVAAAVMRMLEKDPEDRWTTITQAAQALGGAMLSEDDPVRAYLIFLAGAGPAPEVELAPHRPSQPVDESGRVWQRNRVVAISRIEIRVPARQLTVGETAQLRASLFTEDGTVLPNQALAWSSSRSDVASVSATGLVTALSEGSAAISIACQGHEATGEIVVVRPEVAKVHVTAPRDRIFVGENLAATAWATDARGHQMRDRPVMWSTTAEIAVVTPAGIVTALRPGSATITAEIEGHSGSLILRVLSAPVASIWIAQESSTLEAGTTLQLTARLKDADGRPLYDREIRWTSERPGVVTVTQEGAASALSPGTSRITATVDELSATTEITVTPAGTAAVRVTPHPTLLPVGRSIRLTAVAEDRGGRPLSGRTIEWGSDRSDIVVVTSDGRARGVAPGAAVITARCEGAETTIRLTVGSRRHPAIVPAIIAATVLVVAAGIRYWPKPEGKGVDRPPRPPQLASLTFETGPDRVRVGDSLILVARALDSSGAPIDAPLVYSSQAPSIAQVTGNRVLFLALGVSWLAVHSGNRADSMRIEVLPKSTAVERIAALEFDSPRFEIELGDSQVVRLLAKDSAGAQILGKQIVLTSATPTVAVVRQRAALWYVVGVGRGQSRIQAVGEGVEAAATVDVKLGSVALVEVSPDPVNLTVGDTTRLKVRLVDTRNQPTEGSVTWTSSDEARAIITSEGLVTAKGAGSLRISAQAANGRRGFAVATVQPRVVDSVKGPDPHDSTRTEVTLSASKVVAGGFACALAESGLNCWGSAGSPPSPVEGSLVSVSIGGRHACGLTTSGTALCWGNNSQGQLGTGRAEASPRPVPVSGNLRFTSITAGTNHSCGVTDGVVYCWGRNGGGQLGDGSTANRSDPAPVRGNNLPRFREVTAGTDHTCALAEDGSAYCWGDDVSGAVGVGAKQRESEPTAIGKGKFTFTGLWAGARHTCGLTAQGIAYCWGDNQNGQVGIGSRSEEVRLDKPVQGNQVFRELTLGENHSCGVTRDRFLYCWGNNRDGQLGDNSDQGRTRPVQSAGGQAVLAASAGDNFTCAISAERTVLCWGRNTSGQLGDGTTQNRLEPVSVRPR